MKRLLVGVALAVALTGTAADAQVTPEEAEAIAEEAYVYGFPMVVHYKVLQSYVLDEASPEYKAPFNQFGCAARAYTPDDRAVVTPNSDTPYCMGFALLTDGPVVLTTPAVEAGRYFSVQLIDAYTHNFAYVGSISTGSDAQASLLVGPGWDGDLPAGIDRLLRCETDLVFAIVRTQLFGPDDLARVAEIQLGYQLVPLQVHLGGAPQPPPTLPAAPEWVEGAQFDARAFAYIDYMLDLTQPIEAEAALRSRFAEIGIGAPGEFDLDALEPSIQTALGRGAASGFRAIEESIAVHSSDPLISTKIFGTRGFLEQSARDHFGQETHYLTRAMAAQAGLYGNSASEATYPAYFVDASNAPLDAAQARYSMTFPADGLPPVSAFWSLTMYDGPTQLLVDNPLDRYLLDSTMADQFVTGDDGSLTLYLQAEPPGTDLEPNWLPAPAGPFYAILRLYGPQEPALTGEWTSPPLIRAE